MKKILLPDLNETVARALDLFSSEKLPRFSPAKFRFPFVVGSGNAYNAGAIMFSGQPAVLASESDFRQKLKSYSSLIKNGTIKQAVIISASGGKDSVWEIQAAKKAGLETTLLTCNLSSPAAHIAETVIAFPKNSEPYTYNVSTYLGMILGASEEKLETIKTFLKKLSFPKKFDDYRAYSFILPDSAAAVAPMLDIKRHELFGPYLSLRAFSFGEARHAKFVNPWNKELVISLGKNDYFGLEDGRWEIELPRGAGNGLIMALTYSIIGRIQKNKPPYFKKNIARYCQEGPKAYGKTEPFEVVVK